jgi:hypothetical protein
MEKISWTDHVRNEEVLLRVKEWRKILHEILKRKANWIGHFFCRNCLLQQVIEGKIQGGIEVRGRRGRRCRKLLDDLKERTGYCHLKEEALDRFGVLHPQHTQTGSNSSTIAADSSNGVTNSRCCRYSCMRS